MVSAVLMRSMAAGASEPALPQKSAEVLACDGGGVTARAAAALGQPADPGNGLRAPVISKLIETARMKAPYRLANAASREAAWSGAVTGVAESAQAPAAGGTFEESMIETALRDCAERMAAAWKDRQERTRG